MAITKGIVSGGNYTFSAANQSITFSSDYLGMSLSDITYITNIKSGVATVIYDPFDATKGGVLNGLTLTLNYNTTLMGDTDPLQIIVGFTPSNPAPINVNVLDTSEQETQRVLLQSMADDLDLIALAMDEAQKTPLNVKETSIKKDIQGAIIPSDAPAPIIFTLSRANDQYVFDTSGYQHIAINATPSSANLTVSFQGRNENSAWSNVPAIIFADGVPATSVGFGLGSSFTTPHTWFIPVTHKFIRIFINTYSAGSVTYTAYLKQSPLPTGPFTQIPVSANINQISGAGPQVSGGTATTTTQGINQFGGIQVGGPFFPTTNAPNAASTLQTSVVYPFGIAGREQPYIGALSGLSRYITVDGGGRYILGGDTPDTETRTQSKRADGSIPGIPPRGVGARSNNMFGSQSLLVEDISQSEGDTTTTLLQQILVELKMLNQQINELPLTLNLGIKMQNEVSDYRTEEYNNHVNNQ